MAPRVLGLAAVQINFWINTVLASGLPAGSLSALNYAWLLMLLPQGIVAQGVATAAFPTFAQLDAEGRHRELRRALGGTLRAVLFLTLPATVGLFVWRVPLVRLLLERGAFTAESTQLTAFALAFYAPGLIAHSLVEIASRAFYALHDTRTPVVIGVGSMALNVLLSLALRPVLNHAGLALANTVATTLEMLLLLWLLSRRLHGLEWPRFSATAVRSVVASAAMAVPLVLTATQIGQWPLLLIVVTGLSLAAVVYLVTAVLLGAQEAHVVRRLLRR